MSASAVLPKNARLLVIYVARIGDTLLATPALRALKAACPDGELTMIAHPKRMSVLEQLPYVDHLRGLSKRSVPWLGRFTALTGKPYDCAFVYGRDAALIRYASRVAKRVIAFRQDDPAVDALLAPAVPPPGDLIHAVDERLLLPLAAGVAPAGRRLAYLPSAAEQAWAADWRRQHLDTPRLVGLQTASFPSKPYRNWPADNFSELCRRLLATYADLSIVLFGDGGDRERALAIAAGQPRIKVVAGDLSLRQSAALMATLDLYVGVDTGPTHLAGALGVPMVALYHRRHPGRCLAPQEHPAFLAVIDQPAESASESATTTAADPGMAAVSVDQVWQQVAAALTDQHAAASMKASA